MDAENVFAICDGTTKLEEAKVFGSGFIPDENFVLVTSVSSDVDGGGEVSEGSPSADKPLAKIKESVAEEEDSPDLQTLLGGILLKQFKVEDEEDDVVGADGERGVCGACCSLM